jgi:hypothetical protein
MADNAKAINRGTLKAKYGNITSTSIGAIQCKSLILDAQAVEYFFNEPSVKLDDLMKRLLG